MIAKALAAVLCGFTALTAAASADSPATGGPLRHLVYSFTYGSQQNATARDSSEISTSSSNISHYGSSLGDKGTMVVDVQREQPDKGLVVVIGENAEATRKAPPATCVVYASTEVICDPNKTVNPEEYTLLRFLASNFVDPNILDAKKHWGFDSETGGVAVKADYTIVSNNGSAMTIDEVRSVKQPGTDGMTTNVVSKIGYNFDLRIPTSIQEYTTQRSDHGVGGNSTTIYQTDLKLVTDSMAKSG